MSASFFKLVMFLTVFIGNDFILLVRLGELLLTAEVLYLEIIEVYIDIDYLNTFSKYISV